MIITDYTTPSDIRAALGVSEDELEDTTISLEVYAVAVEADLRDLRVSFLTDYETVKALPSPTDAQEWFLKVTQLFVTYSAARQLLSGLPLFAPKTITDGKASADRFATNPYADTIASVNEKYAAARARLVVALEAAVPAQTVTITSFRPLIAVAASQVDPVTGA